MAFTCLDAVQFSLCGIVQAMGKNVGLGLTNIPASFGLGTSIKDKKKDI